MFREGTEARAPPLLLAIAQLQLQLTRSRTDAGTRLHPTPRPRTAQGWAAPDADQPSSQPQRGGPSSVLERPRGAGVGPGSREVLR